MNVFSSFDITHFDGALLGLEISRTDSDCERKFDLPSTLSVRLALAIAI